MLPITSVLLICNERSMIFFSRKRNIIIRDAPSVLGASWKRQLTETYHKCGAQALYSTIVLKKNTYFSNRSTPNITLVYIAYIGLDPFQNFLSALKFATGLLLCVCVCVCFAKRGQGFCRTGRKVPCYECRSRTTEIKRAKPILYSRLCPCFC